MIKINNWSESSEGVINFFRLVKQLLGVRGGGKIDQFFVESRAHSDK